LPFASNTGSDTSLRPSVTGNDLSWSSEQTCTWLDVGARAEGVGDPLRVGRPRARGSPRA
jgi:hypothetical protein